jgi:hypothetical protein
MLQYPPIIIINGVDNDNTLQENCIMPETCPSHGRHELQLATHDREFKEVKEEMKKIASELTERVKGKVFWTMVLIFFASMGAIYSKQDKVLAVMNQINTSQQLVQKDIEVMKIQIKELKGEDI